MSRRGAWGETHMRLIGLLQARGGSTRLPNKSIMDVNGLPIIEHIRNRMCAVGTLDDVVVSTSLNSFEIIDFCKDKNWKFWAGSEDDLLSRHLGAALTYDADAILRCTGDQLFHDPVILEKMVAAFRNSKQSDAIINWHMGRRSISEGLDAEIVTVDAMRKLAQNVNCPREDWMTFLDRSERFRVGGWSYPNRVGHDIHLSIDTPDDLGIARKMMLFLGNDNWKYQNTLAAYKEVTSEA